MWATIKTLITAIPLIAEAVRAVVAWFNKNQEEKILKHYEKKKQLRDRITARIISAKTDEERAELSKDLSLLDSDY